MALVMQSPRKQTNQRFVVEMKISCHILYINPDLSTLVDRQCDHHMEDIPHVSHRCPSQNAEEGQAHKVTQLPWH